MNDSNAPQEAPKSISDRVVARRDLLHGSARVLLVGGLLTYFVQQRKRSNLLADDPSCVKLETCSDCIEFGGCDLPKSHDHRAHISGDERPKTS